MSDNRTPQHERRAQTRAALLQAAGRVFAEHGYHAATLESVYRSAGVSRGALYHYFGSKRELFAALLADRLASAATVADAAGTEPDGDPIARFLNQVGRNPRWLPLLLDFLALGARDPETRGVVITRFIRPARARVARWTDQLPGLKHAPITGDELAIATTALINGLAIEQAFDPDGVPEDLGARVLALIAAGLEHAEAHGVAE